MPFSDVHHAYNNGGFPRPLPPLPRSVNRAAMLTDPPQSGRSRITLPNGVSRNQPKTPMRTQQIKRTSKEMRHQIRVPMRLFMYGLQPIEITIRMSLD